jgi:hypothetical protein
VEEYTPSPLKFMKFEYTLTDMYILCPSARNDFMPLSPSILAAPPHHHAALA